MIRTWMGEMAAVAVVLALVAIAGGGGWLQWLTAAAVLTTFGHVQVASRLEEADGARPEPSVACRAWLTRYLVVKEVLWSAAFAATGSWPALAGCAVFGLYPTWRRWWRS